MKQRSKSESQLESTAESNDEKPPSWWVKFIPFSSSFNLFNKVEPPKPINSREELIDEIRLAKTNDLIAADALSMIEGVMEVDHLQSRDIMLSVSQIQFIHRDDTYRQILAQVLESGHSRYPVIDENRDDIDGILHAKDLLKYSGKEESFTIDDVLRPPLYSPETQRLNELLTEFKKSRNHMAVIVDEYGGISGLVTMEDILEQIVGEIDDEHDIDEIPNIHLRENNLYTVNALTPIKEFNGFFNSKEEVTQFDTIGGLVTHKMGKIPNPEEKLMTSEFKYTVLNSDGRRIQSLVVEPLFKLEKKNSKDKKNEKGKTSVTAHSVSTIPPRKAQAKLQHNREPTSNTETKQENDLESEKAA